ncbi:MAG: hypothetical protein A3G34_06315 [Candidatus Lindowbacteria bacterium RIFCSPLOWO2_12_FULL_62_27]|nr:MAG: hypothetical protein A3G34_06315 [Candidatus Lindowbacteria bacterium RIFCSPLOWO2_12_FULL_62_27]OGH58777.1 MAG: hypothetical protein A3I06_09710 [Candidatus Lindowbacteria bacterium RIFCSPLOWO2_02_FULL_62_12]
MVFFEDRSGVDVPPRFRGAAAFPQRHVANECLEVLQRPVERVMVIVALRVSGDMPRDSLVRPAGRMSVGHADKALGPWKFFTQVFPHGGRSTEIIHFSGVSSCKPDVEKLTARRRIGGSDARAMKSGLDRPFFDASSECG